ncbi:Regulatory protein BlaR1 [Symmachiella dynata]|uniref:Regulatory protein BlaR1 n=1 Tax=Symmachiella dynata TaxID=2527995 RepID=A0A517ZHI4_9PLAN|nr:M56 family metallopeptidase [Symmachiella dynata]QDU41912.1 Regulatory protein BlaR1 [Symmachiella dynata]
MNTLFESFSSSFTGNNASAFAFDMAVRSTVLLLVALIALAICRRASAAARHRLWLLSVVGVLLIPILYLAAPQLKFALPGGDKPARFSEATSITSQWLFTETIPSSKPNSAQPATPASPETLETASKMSVVVDAPAWHTGDVLLVAWAAGVVIVGLLSLISIASAQLLVRKSAVLTDDAWQGLLLSLREQLGISRMVQLRSCDRPISPMTWGLWRPVILLPRDCASWTDECRRAVLLHELAHIQRHDWLSQMLAQTACVVYWFHPLVWFANRQVRKESDRAADDVVLTAGMPATTYAEQLLVIAQQISTEWLHPAPAMARRGQLSQRIGVLLDPRRNRRGLGRRAAVLMTVVAICAVAFIGVVSVTVAEDEALAAKPTSASKPATADDKLTEAKKRIERALQSKLDVEIEDMPLQEVAKYFGRQLDVNVWIDEAAINQQGLRVDTPMTIKRKSISAHSALTELLGPWQLVAVANGDVLQITRDPLTNRERIERELQNTTEVDFQDQPLTDVVLYLKDLHNIQIVIDDAALNDAGIDPDSPVNMTLAGNTAEFALRLILEPLGLEAVVDDDVLKITTKSVAAGILETRVYDLKNILGSAWGPQQVDLLRQAIIKCDTPTTWTEAGGAGVIAQGPATDEEQIDTSAAGILVIRQTTNVHQQILELLADLRSVLNPPGEKTAELTTREKNEQAIRKALASPTEVDFQDQPLTDVVLYLEDLHNIQTIVDDVALNDEGISTDTPISLTLAGIPLQKVLRLMLGPIKLQAVPYGEVLLITTASRAKELQIVRIYDVSDVPFGQDPKVLAATIQSTVAPGSWKGAKGGGAIAPFSGSILRPENQIDPFRVNNLLIVRQTEQGHEQVAALLKQLRRVKR